MSRLLLTSFLHLLQPLARLTGRLRHGLTPWRRRGPGWAFVPGPTTLWSETWRGPEAWLGQIRETASATGAVVLAGGAFDRWDLEARGGALGSARLRMAIEEHGAGRQLLRVRAWPRFSSLGVLLMLLLGLLAAAAAGNRDWIAAVTLAVLALLLAARMLIESTSAAAVLRASVREVQAAGEPAVESFLDEEELDAVGVPAAD